MSLLSLYEERTAWKYEPVHGSFPTNVSLACKVDAEGKFLPFPGSTAVFRLDITSIRILRLMRSFLYRGLVDTGMLAQALPAATFHMTLHDLVNRNQVQAEGNEAQAAFEAKLERSLDAAQGIVEEIRREYAGRKLHMVADRIVNLLSTAVALMVKPASEEDFSLFMDLYQRFDPIAPLPYPPTPHITLAYFRPGELDGERLGAAIHAMQVNADSPVAFELPVEALTAQRFQDMQRYEDVPLRICFCCDGGLNRSVMSANILNHLAKVRELPILGFARSAYGNTRGEPVSEQVWRTLEQHGIPADRSQSAAQYLEAEEVVQFSQFALLSEGAADRIAFLGVPKERYEEISGYFRGVRDPMYEVSYEEAYTDIFQRVNRFLEDWKRR